MVCDKPIESITFFAAFNICRPFQACLSGREETITYYKAGQNAEALLLPEIY